MASVYTDSTRLTGTFKDIFGPDGVDNLIPETAMLTQMIKFGKADKIGEQFSWPVNLSHSQSVTYLGEDAGVTTLEDHQASVKKEAKVNSHGMLFRDAISYNTANKMTSSREAFINWSEMIFGGLTDTATKRLELAYRWGQKGLGTITAVNNSSGTNVLTLGNDFSAGIWAGMEGAKLDCFNAALSTKRNGNAELVVSAVDFEAKTVTVTGNTTDTAAISASSDVLFFKGVWDTSTWKEMAGIDKIITNTGTLFNISAATYGLWKGHSHSAGSANLNLNKLFKGLAKPQALGASGEMALMVHADTFADLNSDESALRRHPSGYRQSKADAGFEELCFYNGPNKLIVKLDLYAKPNQAHAFPVKHMKRIGATDLTFKLPGQKEDQDIFLHLEDKNAFEIRCQADLAIASRKPAWMLKFTDIVNG